MTSIYDIDKGDHLCADRHAYFHHFIVEANYVKEDGGSKNGKEFGIIEYTGPQWAASASAMVEITQRSLDDYGTVYKINYAKGEVSPGGKLQMNISGCIRIPQRDSRG